MSEPIEANMELLKRQVAWCKQQLEKCPVASGKKGEPQTIARPGDSGKPSPVESPGSPLGMEGWHVVAKGWGKAVLEDPNYKGIFAKLRKLWRSGLMRGSLVLVLCFGLMGGSFIAGRDGFDTTILRTFQGNDGLAEMIWQDQDSADATLFLLKPAEYEYVLGVYEVETEEEVESGD